ncbi:WD repeat-containing protein 74, partial [Notothenia coriiceps]|uniref:WD repeat-containing protein 74 n=1 Tax=Notothenia coriiceps TaxID=8208 RepID=A0A6I9PIN7_9TELE
RRPVMEMEFGEHPLTALSLPTGGTSVVVGNTRGEVAVLDLRKGLVRGVLKGLCGGVRALQCHPSLPIVASCGLDRFLRIHSLGDRKLQHKVYLKSRLNCLLLASQREEWGGGAGAGGEEVKKEEEEEEEEDEVWENMERVEEQGKRKSTTEEEEMLKKKSKKGED